MDPFVAREWSISLSTWATIQGLRHAGHLEISGTSSLHRFHQHIEKPTADLSVYLTPLQSYDFAFISHLRLAGSCLIKAEELLYLPRWSKNLGLLELLEPSNDKSPFPQLSDRLFKAWSLDSDSFPKLKGIRLSTRRSVTEQSLRCLTKLPALIMLEITAGKQDWEHSGSLARGLGWIYCKGAKALSHYDDDNGDVDDPDSQSQASLESHRCWQQLCMEIYRLDVGPSPTTAWNTHGTLKPSGYEIYSLLDLPASSMLQQPLLMGAPIMSSALASLTLGSDRTFTSNSEHVSRWRHIFFWRCWQDGIRYPKASEGDAQEACKKPPDTKRSDSAASGSIRSRKKRKTGSLGEMLSLFES
ncbi:hypothetical protein Daus18300_008631 [Diaporthe australafricana]|uniref:Uncharacterized protein n=1 Tax=Diaporthe australafricana TaxID=127596 RepID=A0ABR3WHU1_9PEZI